MDSEKKLNDAFENWRVRFFGRHSPYPIEACTHFGAGYEAGRREGIEEAAKELLGYDRNCSPGYKWTCEKHAEMVRALSERPK